MDRSEWVDGNLITEHVDWAARYVVGRVDHYLRQHLPLNQAQCESPIEALFMLWWSAVQFAYHRQPHALEDGWGFSVHDWYPVPQQVVVIGDATYRLDFELATECHGLERELRRYRLPRIAIELDGHEFHERTREQVVYRNSRDRALQCDEWQVLHFSGSEVVKDPIWCVTEAMRAAQKIVRRRAELAIAAMQNV